MRTTLQLDDDIYRAARSLAASQRKTVGEVVSALARRGLVPAAPTGKRRGVPVFAVPEGTPAVTLEDVKRALEDSA